METSQDTAYTKEEYKELYPEGFELFFWNRFRTEKIGRLLRTFTWGKILDIGCGRGHIVKYLRRCGLDAEGCELSSAAVPCSPEIASFFYPGTDACSLSQEKREEFQTLLLLDVLEHIEKPDLFLKSLLDKFPRCRNILVTVPAFMELWDSYVDSKHYRRYTKDSFAELIEKVPELQTIRAGYFFHSLYPVKLLTKDSCGRNEVKSVNGFCSRIINSLAYFYFRFEDALLPASCRGSSLYAVIQVRKMRG